jgi:hypothetical protein
MRLFVLVKGDEIVVTSLTGFRAAYLKRPNHPQLIFGGELKTMTNYCLLRRGRQQPQRRVSWGGLFRKWAHTARHHTPHGERGILRVYPRGSQIGVGAAVLRAITPVLGSADLSATVMLGPAGFLPTAEAHFVMRPQRV